MKPFLTLILAISLVEGPFGYAKDEARDPALRASLSSVPTAELPAKAVEILKQAKPRQWETASVGVVKAAVAINPAAAPAIVGALAKAAPNLASVMAATAATEQPQLASAIAQAAAAAAPSEAGKIVAAVCRAVPNQYRTVAIAASQAVPASNRDVLLAVASALPHLKASLEQALANCRGAIPPVGPILELAAQATQVPTVSGSSPMAKDSLPRGAAIGPPYVPWPGTAGNVNPSTSGEVPTGGRNYAQP